MNYKNRKMVLGMMAAAVSVAVSGMNALAEEFVTPDSVLSLETPDDDWQQIADPGSWMTLGSDGQKITLMHYSNGEKLPDIAVADDDWAEVCQSILSTENEVFIITGYVEDAEDFDRVREAVQSAKILKYDTKKAVAPASDGAVSVPSGGWVVEESGPDTGSEGTASDGTVETAGGIFTGYVTDNVNVRSDASTDASVIGALSRGDAVMVTGTMQDGAWYQIRYNNATGYVSAQYISQELLSAEILGITLTDEQLCLYQTDGNAATYINKATDGNWYDGSGRQYQLRRADSWMRLSDGSSWTDIAPANPSDKSAAQIQVKDKDGLNTQTLYQDEATGGWQNIAGGVYSDNGDGSYTGPDGTLWYRSE